jgi:RNAse (barnase) inhibitor barstar
MKKVTLDLRNISSAEALHKELQKALNFPAHYGMNGDALFDCITGDTELPLQLTFIISPGSLNEEMKKICKILGGISEIEENFEFIVQEK